jgi:hypothetical protein
MQLPRCGMHAAAIMHHRRMHPRNLQLQPSNGMHASIQSIQASCVQLDHASQQITASADPNNSNNDNKRNFRSWSWFNSYSLQI